MQYFSHDADLMKSVNSLIKFNNGLFKSIKQKGFLSKIFERNAVDGSNFGTNLGPKVFWLSGTVRWASYGSNSLRPYGFAYEFDEFGITRQYKLGWQGTMRDGTSIDPSKTTLLWMRPDHVSTEHLVEEVKPVEAVPESHVLGLPGEKITIEAVVLMVRDISSRFGLSKLVKLRTLSGSDVTVFTTSDVSSLVPQATVSVSGRIKGTDVYNGRIQNVLTRCKFQVIGG